MKEWKGFCIPYMNWLEVKKKKREEKKKEPNKNVAAQRSGTISLLQELYNVHSVNRSWRIYI